jgi:hypothetical protein
MRTAEPRYPGPGQWPAGSPGLVFQAPAQAEGSRQKESEDFANAGG